MFRRLCVVAMVACGPQMASENTDFQLLYSEIMQPVGLTLPTLLIVNEGIERFRIYGAVGLLGSVYPGETKCVTLGREGEQVLEIRSLRESEITPIFWPAHGQGWEIYLGLDLRFDVHSLQPGSICTR